MKNNTKKYFTFKHLKISLKNPFPFMLKIGREDFILKKPVLEIKMKKKRWHKIHALINFL